jgi:hypothetical protein
MENNKWYANREVENNLEGLTKEYAMVLQSNVFSLSDAEKKKYGFKGCSELLQLRMSFRTEYGKHLKYTNFTNFGNLIQLRTMTRLNVNDLEGTVCELYMKNDEIKEVCVNINLLP